MLKRNVPPCKRRLRSAGSMYAPIVTMSDVCNVTGLMSCRKLRWLRGTRLPFVLRPFPLPRSFCHHRRRLAHPQTCRLGCSQQSWWCPCRACRIFQSIGRGCPPRLARHPGHRVGSTCRCRLDGCIFGRSLFPSVITLSSGTTYDRPGSCSCSSSSCSWSRSGWRSRCRHGLAETHS